MELFWIAVGAIGAVVILVLLGRAAIRRQRERARKVAAAEQRAARRQDPLAEDVPTGGNPMELKVGDLVEFIDFAAGGRRTYYVRGQITCREGKYEWREFLIDTGTGDKCWLSVEKEEGDVTVILWHEVPNHEVDLGDRSVTHDGTTYRLDEHSTASYTSEETTGLQPAGTVEYFDYKGPNETWFTRERFDGAEWESGVGKTLDQAFLVIYPAA